MSELAENVRAYLEEVRLAVFGTTNPNGTPHLTGLWYELRGDTIVLFPEATSSDANRVLPFRSALVGAARAALAEPALRRLRLQPLAIAYVRRDGLPVTRADRPAIAWYGDMELVPHLSAFLRAGPLDAVVVWGPPIPFDAGSDRKQAARAAEAAVRASVRRAAVARDRGGTAASRFPFAADGLKPPGDRRCALSRTLPHP